MQTSDMTIDGPRYRVAGLIEYAVWPSVILLAVSCAWLLSSVNLKLVTAVSIAVIVARLFVMLLEVLLPLRRETQFYRDRFTWHDIAFSLYRETLGRWSGLLLIFLILGAVKTPSYWPTQLPIALQAIILYLVYTFLEYWEHRAEHRIPLLWRFHAIHHSPSRMHHFKMDRHHFVSVLASWLFIFMPLLALHPPLALMVWLGLYEQVSSALKHSNIRQRFPGFLQYILATPQLHHIHHSTIVAHGNSNYANMAFWDVLFGTFTPPQTEVPAYGVANSDIPQSIGGAYLFSFRNSLLP